MPQFFNSSTLKHVHCNLFYIPGEDVWGCSVNAPGEQAGPGWRTRQRSGNRGGAAVGRGEGVFGYSNNFLQWFFLIMFLRRKENIFLFFFRLMILNVVLWFMQQHQALFYECSAKSGCNMEELMTHLARYIFLLHILCFYFFTVHVLKATFRYHFFY